MKKLWITRIMLATVFCATSAGTYGQFYVGGSIGLGTTGGSVKYNNTENDKAKSMNFNISPMVGRYLNARWSVACRFGFEYGSVTTPAVSPLVSDEKETTLGWAVTPFTRCKLAGFGRFSFVAEGGIRFGGSSGKVSSGDVTIDGPRTFACGLYIQPLITFRANDHWILGMGSNLAAVGFGISSTTTGSGSNKVKDRDNYFNIGIDLNDVAGTLGEIQMGVLYKF